jgi:hypothetical protein
MEIRPATRADIDALALLFDAYRQFYDQPSDVAGATAFLRARFDHQQSTIFVADTYGTLIGFTQLYPSFSSTRMVPIFILRVRTYSFHVRGVEMAQISGSGGRSG